MVCKMSVKINYYDKNSAKKYINKEIQGVSRECFKDHLGKI